MAKAAKLADCPLSEKAEITARRGTMKTAICSSYPLSPTFGGQILRVCRSIAWPGIVLLVSIALIASDRPANGQILGKLKDKLKTAGANLSLSQLLEQQPITTSIDDVVFDVPFLDTHEPPYYRLITALPPAPGGGWALRPGSYEYFAQSYCLRAGTHRPGRGTGYAYAPLKGPQADVVRSILRNSARFPDIPQSDIQSLLWRIIARAKFNNLSMNEKKTAAELLSPEQLALLNRSALDLLPGDALNRTLGGASPMVRRALEADAQLRQAFASGNMTYDQLERIALPDDPSEPSDRIPPERWSFNPEGYFIRYLPHTYSQTVIQIEVPGPIELGTDAKGRIVSISDPAGRRVLQIAYDDSWMGDPYAGAGGIRAFRFHSVHFERRDPAARGSLLRADWTDPAGTLMGVPSLAKPRSTPLDARYEFARKMTIDTRRLLSSFPHRQESTRDLELLANLVHLEVGLERMLTLSAETKPWTLSQLDLVMDAWQFTLCRLAGAGGAATRNQPSFEWRGGWTGASDVRVAGSVLVTSRVGGPFAFFDGSPLAFAPQAPSGSGGSFDPTGGVAQPASDGAQRLGQSQRMHPSGVPCGQPGQVMCPCDFEGEGEGGELPCATHSGVSVVGMMGAHPPGPQFEADFWK